MRIAALFAAVAIALATAPAAHAAPPGAPAAGMPTANEYSAQVLQEREGVVSWKTLAGVEMIQQGIALVPKFSADVAALDRQDVTIQGFMIPIEVGATQKRFFISGVPPECPFCLPAGPEALVEVQAKSGVKPASQPIVLSGRFELVKDAGEGLLYRLTDAVPKGFAKTTAAASPR
jgi:hypothetical protein